MRPLARLLSIGALLASGATAAQSQSTPARIPAEKEAVIRRILELTKAGDNMLLSMETTIPAQRASNPAIPAEFWDRFMARAREGRYAFVDSLVPIYDKFFTTAELRDLLRFYESPTGKRMIVALPQVMTESMAAGQRWGFQIGKQIGEELQREAMAGRRPDGK